MLILPKNGWVLDTLSVFCYTVYEESRKPRDRARLSIKPMKVKRTRTGFGVVVRFFASAERWESKICRDVLWRVILSEGRKPGVEPEGRCGSIGISPYIFARDPTFASLGAAAQFDSGSASAQDDTGF